MAFHAFQWQLVWSLAIFFLHWNLVRITPSLAFKKRIKTISGSIWTSKRMLRWICPVYTVGNCSDRVSIALVPYNETQVVIANLIDWTYDSWLWVCKFQKPIKRIGEKSFQSEGFEMLFSLCRLGRIVSPEILYEIFLRKIRLTWALA